ncbi:hypothetical protein ABID22_000532 [Pontibacter aydingkolensis]
MRLHTILINLTYPHIHKSYLFILSKADGKV